jgi:hypothetical protein
MAKNTGMCAVPGAHPENRLFQLFLPTRDPAYFFFVVHSTSRSIIVNVPFIVAPSTVPL